MKPTPETNRSVKDLAKGLQGKIVFQAPPGTNRPLTRSQSKAAQNNQTHTNKQNSLVSGPVFTAPMPERNFLEKTPSVSALQNELLSQNLSRTPSPKGKEVKEEITANTTRRPSPPSQAVSYSKKGKETEKRKKKNNISSNIFSLFQSFFKIFCLFFSNFCVFF